MPINSNFQNISFGALYRRSSQVVEKNQYQKKQFSCNSDAGDVRVQEDPLELDVEGKQGMWITETHVLFVEHVSYSTWMKKSLTFLSRFIQKSDWLEKEKQRFEGPSFLAWRLIQLKRLDLFIVPFISLKPTISMGWISSGTTRNQTIRWIIFIK